MSPDESKTSPPERRRWRWALLIFAVLLLAILAGAIGSCISVRIPESGSRQTVVFYTRHTDLIPGARLDPDDLEARLGRLGYLEVADSLDVGQYRQVAGRFEIYLRPC